MTSISTLFCWRVAVSRLGLRLLDPVCFRLSAANITFNILAREVQVILHSHLSDQVSAVADEPRDALRHDSVVNKGEHLA